MTKEEIESLNSPIIIFKNWNSIKIPSTAKHQAQNFTGEFLKISGDLSFQPNKNSFSTQKEREHALQLILWAHYNLNFKNQARSVREKYVNLIHKHWCKILLKISKMYPAMFKTDSVILFQECKVGLTWGNLWMLLCSEELTLPKDRSGLCPRSWEVTFKLMKFPE